MGAAKALYQQQGFGGFYQGAGMYVAADGMAGSLKFATYEVLKRKWDKRVSLVTDRKKRETMERYGVFAIAGVAFIASSVVLVPGELIKQRLQLGQITSVRQGVAHIFKTEGPLGFFTGYSAVCYRDVPYTMFELGVYENLKRAYLGFKQKKAGREGGSITQITQVDELICAALTGGFTGYLSNPLDIVKTKMMTDAAYGSFGCAFMQQVGTYGWGSLLQGGVARVAWLMPFTAIYLPVYEEIKRTLLAARVKGKAVAGIRGGAEATAAADNVARIRGGGGGEARHVRRFASVGAGWRRRPGICVIEGM